MHSPYMYEINQVYHKALLYHRTPYLSNIAIVANVLVYTPRLDIPLGYPPVVTIVGSGVLSTRYGAFKETVHCSMLHTCSNTILHYIQI